MSKSDREHFQSYRLQTRVKHEIICDYLPAYFNIIKKWTDKLVFIDGFAGRGHYVNEETGEAFPGSPLLALDLVAGNPEFSKRAICVFVENDKENVEELDASVTSFLKDHGGLSKPIVVRGKFSEQIGGVLKEFKEEGKILAPTFMLVDPCGVEDVSMRVVAGVLSIERCEVFVFFNLDGIRRIAGLARREHLSPVLVDLLGSEAKATELVKAFLEAKRPEEGERCIVAAYVDALKESGTAEYVIPFRVESEHRRTTSHYLIHATKHPLGFKIMKHVMWEKGRVEGEDEGQLELLQASAGTLRLIRPELVRLEEAILQALESGPLCASTFYDDWVMRSDDMFSEGAYRRTLLRMEEEGKVVVLDEDGHTLLPVNQRPRRKGPTLAKRLLVAKA